MTIAHGSSPAGARTVSLSAKAAACIRAATKAAGANEACGLLFGAAGAIADASVARNVSAEPWHRFEIDPAHLFEAQRRDRAGPLNLLGCWHSHPDGSLVPSRHDHAGAVYPGWLWLIAANGQIAAWRPTDAGFEPVALRPVVLRPVVLRPVALQPVALQPVALQEARD